VTLREVHAPFLGVLSPHYGLPPGGAALVKIAGSRCDAHTSKQPRPSDFRDLVRMLPAGILCINSRAQAESQGDRK